MGMASRLTASVLPVALQVDLLQLTRASASQPNVEQTCLASLRMYNSCGPFEESVRLARILNRNTQQLNMSAAVQLIPHPPCPFSFSYCEVLQRHLVGKSYPELSFYLNFAYMQHTTSMTRIVLSSMTN